MKRIITEWSAKELYQRRNMIQYPEYQREPTVWSEGKKALLVDSMLIDLDIPKIYLYNPKWKGKDPLDPKVEENDVFDCVDGRQRIAAVIEFFENHLKLADRRYLNDLSGKEKAQFSQYKFTIVVITEARESELRLLFLRLQLGAPLNVGEKLHVLTGEMKDFVFKYGKSHPFFTKLSIPKRRFAKETVFAQICINSFNRAREGTFCGARYEELKEFFKEYSDLSNCKKDAERILHTLDMLNEYFGKKAAEFKNRAIIVSVYLFFEKLITNEEIDQLPLFTEFYLKFLEELSRQSALGLDYDRQYRELLDFQTNILQAAVGKAAITARNRILEEYFAYYQKFKKIKTIE